VWVETLRNIFIADYNNYLIRKVSYATGIIATIAGIGTSGTVTAYNNTAATSANYFVQLGHGEIPLGMCILQILINIK